MRKQYYFRDSPRGLLAWDVDRLVAISSAFPRKMVPLSALRDADEAWLRESDALDQHLKLIEEADLSYPIILSASGELMDGRHRVVKAIRQGALHIQAVQFESDPTPDFVGLRPDELPY